MADKATDKEKRAKIARRVYKFTDGRESANAGPGVESLTFKFENGEARTVTLAEVGDNCREALSWHGLSQKLGDKFSSAGGDVTGAIQMFEAQWDNLCNDVWLQRGEGSVRVNYLVDAIVNCLINDGEEVDDGRRASIWQKVATKEQRERALTNDLIKAEYARLEAERKSAKAKELAKKAKSSEATLEGF